MRIVGGTLRGRPITGPQDGTVRPTADRVRESVFNILAHGVPELELEGARVIDLFAGTGALGLEALSRGAGFCLFVDSDAQSRALIRTNIEKFGLTGVTRIFRRDATDLGPVGTMAPFNLAFLDPPYGQGLGARALASLIEGGWLTRGAIIIAEERADTAFTPPATFTELDRRTYGDTQIVIMRHAA